MQTRKMPRPCASTRAEALDALLPSHVQITFEVEHDGKQLVTLCDLKAETSALKYGRGNTRSEALAFATQKWLVAQLVPPASPAQAADGRSA